MILVLVAAVALFVFAGSCMALALMWPAREDTYLDPRGEYLWNGADWVRS